MNNFSSRSHAIAIAALLAFLGLGCAVAGPNDPVRLANDANAERFADDSPEREAAEFLVRMTDARLMDMAEGRVAAERGTSAAVREYGRVMIVEQQVLLDEIRELADRMGVALPERIGDVKSDGLAELEDEHGEDLDEKFVSMICIDHERDVEEFREAREFEQPDVREYAIRRLPMIEEHLREARVLAEQI